jgi:hypothetical protein
MKSRTDQTLLYHLRELIAALDRRVPRLEREGESDIARDAEALKQSALKRIAELEGPGPSSTIVGSRNGRA